MKSRVTITLNPSIHTTAKSLARHRKTTVSGLIESLLVKTANESAKSSLVDSMIGSATLRQPAPGTDALFDALLKKHITNKPNKRKHARAD
jgi:hypothetical protein